MAPKIFALFPPRNCRVKRLVDLVLGTFFLVLSAPLMLLIAVAVKLSSRGPIFFLQERDGQHGRVFRVVKFRSMAVETKMDVGLELLRSDPRITPVGQLLRRTGLDELPQLLNVLAGQMSLIGPRPQAHWENQLCDPRQARRLLAKPGLTGLCQVSGRNRIPFAERMECDLAYIERASLKLDLWILVKTVPVVLCGRDAYPEPGKAMGHAETPAAPRRSAPCDDAASMAL